ncbi:unnamed protein product, partial [Pylaiella littoralis]
GEVVVSGQWEPGLTLYAVPMTEVGRYLLGVENTQRVHVIESEGGSKEGGGGSSNPVVENRAVSAAYVPFHVGEEWNSKEAKAFGERLCEKNASDWAVAQAADKTAWLVINILSRGIKAKDITEGEIPEGVDIDEVNRLV